MFFSSGLAHDVFSYSLEIIASEIVQNLQHGIYITILFGAEDLWPAFGMPQCVPKSGAYLEQKIHREPTLSIDERDLLLQYPATVEILRAINGYNKHNSND